MDYSLYQSIHYWLRQNYGKADNCENENCSKKSKNYSWALKEGCKYEYKRGNFYQLCRICHAKIDVTEQTRKKMSQINSGKAKHRIKSIRCEVCKKVIKKPYTHHKYCKGCREKVNKRKEAEWRAKQRRLKTDS